MKKSKTVYFAKQYDKCGKPFVFVSYGTVVKKEDDEYMQVRTAWGIHSIRRDRLFDTADEAYNQLIEDLKQLKQHVKDQRKASKQFEGTAQ